MGSGTTTAAGLTLHVSPQGKDVWSGQPAVPNAAQTDGPLATLQGARDELRRLRHSGHLPAGAVTVEFESGRYEQLTPVVFTQEDSGTEAAPVVFTAAPNALVRLTGGVELRQFQDLNDASVLLRLPEAARGKVKTLSLKAQGLNDYGVEPVGTSASPVSGMQLIYGDDVMTLARWPNDGYIEVADIPEGPNGNTFTYTDEHPSRWVDEIDPRGQGYWAFDWGASAIAFDKINTATKTIRQKVPGSNFGFNKGGRWFGYNLLCELDMPGEYYVDRRSGNLYFWPPDKPANTRAEVSVGTGIVQLDNVSRVQFRGLTMENCRGAAVSISNGESVTVAGCTMRNMGDRAVTIHGGKSHRIAGCEMYHLGDGGIMSSAGDEQTLEHCGHVYDNNHIHDYARFSLTYGAAIQVIGCGHCVSHNLIHDGPHVAVLFRGRENLFEYNEIHSVCLYSGEMGAFYAGRNWTMVGNVLRGNYIHDIYNPRPQRNRAMMLDDGVAGMRVTDNLIVRVAEGISLSAIDNVIENNVFVDCHPAITGWQTWGKPEDFAPDKWSNADMLELLAKVPVDAAPWKQRYPHLAMLRDAISDHKLRAPETRTRVEHNVIWGGLQEWMQHYQAYPRSTDTWLIGENNLAGVDPLFVDPAKGDYRMKPASPAFKTGFKPLPIDKMGLYASTERVLWPVKNEVRIVCPNLTYVKP